MVAVKSKVRRSAIYGFYKLSKFERDSLGYVVLLRGSAWFAGPVVAWFANHLRRANHCRRTSPPRQSPLLFSILSTPIRTKRLTNVLYTRAGPVSSQILGLILVIVPDTVTRANGRREEVSTLSDLGHLGGGFGGVKTGSWHAIFGFGRKTSPVIGPAATPGWPELRRLCFWRWPFRQGTSARAWVPTCLAVVVSAHPAWPGGPPKASSDARQRLPHYVPTGVAGTQGRSQRGRRAVVDNRPPVPACRVPGWSRSGTTTALE